MTIGCMLVDLKNNRDDGSDDNDGDDDNFICSSFSQEQCMDGLCEDTVLSPHWVELTWQ